MSGNNFVGSKISLISKAGIRYLGTLVDINAAESTVALENVMSFGTENRPCPTPYPPSKTSYNFVKFRGTDIADLHVFEQTQPQDPAIIEATQGPPNGNMPTAMVPPAQMSPGGPVAAPGNFSSSFSPNTSFTGQNTSGNFPAYSAQGAPTPANSFQEQNDTPKVSTPPRPVADSESKNDHTEVDEQRNESGNYRTSRGRSNNPRKNSYNNNNNRRFREGMPYTNKTLSFEADFDFETSNAKFNKNEMEEEFAKKISKLTLSDPHRPETAAVVHATEEATEKSSEAAEDPDADQCYDRTKSFFDTISCEALEKESGQRRRPPSWHAERSLNSETFGEGVVTYQRRSYQSNNYRGNRSGMNGSYGNNYGGNNYGGNRYNSYNNYSGRNDHYNNYRGGYNNRNDGYNRSSGYRHADNGYNNRDGYRRDYRDGGYNNNNNNNSTSNNRDNGYNNREHTSGYNNRENGYNRDRNYHNRDNNTRDNDRNNYQNRRERPMRYNNDRNDEGQGRASYRRVERNGRPQAQTEAT